MKLNRILIGAIIIIYAISFTSCKKYLDEKPDKKFVIPENLQDCQALLDANAVMNVKDPAAGMISTDDYYMDYSDYNSVSLQSLKRLYIWGADNVFENLSNDYDNSYKAIYRANLVIEILATIKRDESNSKTWDDIKGQALFWRGKGFMQNLWVWSLAYDQSTASTDLGIPLRLSSDFNIPSNRSTVEKGYQQVKQDMEQAAELLPVNSLHVVRPSRIAAYAMLARMYLAMRNYQECGKYANLSLSLKNDLMDYNGGPGVNPALSAPFSRFNPEVIFSSQIPVPATIQAGYVDSALYDSYKTNDLRRTLFFAGKRMKISVFKGNYEGASNYFAGIATDELYLMRAECYARSGNVTDALKDLNTLMVKRWKNDGSFVPYATGNPAEAIGFVLTERRKELVFRGLRWMDLKRLNKDGANINLKRILNGVNYSLPANDLKYAIALPENLIDLSGMPQNPR